MEKKVFYITQTLFIETVGDAQNGSVEATFHVKGKKLNGFVFFSQDPPPHGQHQSVGVIVALSVKSVESNIDVLTLNELLSHIIQNESGIATVLGTAYLAEFFAALF